MPTKRIADVLNYGAICLAGYFDDKPKTIITFGTFEQLSKVHACLTGTECLEKKS